MNKLIAFAQAVGIVLVAVLPGAGAAFTLAAGAPPDPPPMAELAGRVEVVGSYVAMEPGVEEGALVLRVVRTASPRPPGATPAFELR